jgi:predicted metal-dependent hydrolase
MKSRTPSLGQALHRALQLDFFSDLLFPERSRPEVAPQAPKPAPTLTPPPQLKPPRSFSNPSGNRKIQLQDTMLEYSLLRSKRRSIGFLIAEEGLRVTAPRWVTIADIEQAIREKQRWIISKLSERRERTETRLQSAMQWEDGARFLFLGQMLSLRISRDNVSKRHTIDFEEGEEIRELRIRLHSDASEQQLKDAIKIWLQNEAMRVFSARLPVYAEMLGVRYQTMALSNAGTRWGSCTSQGKIRLNWRLIHFAPELIDYVIAHELAHLHEMNHSPRFWARVASVFPDYEQARHRLRHHASADLPAF